MEEQQKKFLLAGLGMIFVFIILLLTSQYFDRARNENITQPTPVSILSKEETANVNKGDDLKFDKKVFFCEKEYKTNGAIVDGVDVVKRVAEIATKNPTDFVCDNVNRNETTDTLVARLTLDKNGKDYYLRITSGYFLITDGKLFKLSGFDGTPSFYGNLK